MTPRLANCPILWWISLPLMRDTFAPVPTILRIPALSGVTDGIYIHFDMGDGSKAFFSLDY